MARAYIYIYSWTVWFCNGQIPESCYDGDRGCEHVGYVTYIYNFSEYNAQICEDLQRDMASHVCILYLYLGHSHVLIRQDCPDSGSCIGCKWLKLTVELCFWSYVTWQVYYWHRWAPLVWPLTSCLYTASMGGYSALGIGCFQVNVCLYHLSLTLVKPLEPDLGSGPL